MYNKSRSIITKILNKPKTLIVFLCMLVFYSTVTALGIFSVAPFEAVYLSNFMEYNVYLIFSTLIDVVLSVSLPGIFTILTTYFVCKKDLKEV